MFHHSFIILSFDGSYIVFVTENASLNELQINKKICLILSWGKSFLFAPTTSTSALEGRPAS